MAIKILSENRWWSGIRLSQCKKEERSSIFI
jgi:hypothetical protein